MIETIRQPAIKVSFSSSEMKAPMLDKKEKMISMREEEIKERFSELKNVEETIRDIQGEIQNKTQTIAQKEGALIEKEQQIVKMAELWKNLNEINLNSLNEEEVKKIVNSQKGFIRDLLEHYVGSSKKEKEYTGRIEELEKRNGELIGEIDSVMREIEGMQEG